MIFLIIDESGGITRADYASKALLQGVADGVGNVINIDTMTQFNGVDWEAIEEYELTNVGD